MSADSPISGGIAAPGQVLVLDTNVVLDIFVFSDLGVAVLTRALAGGAVRVMTSPACLEELRRVLAYPAFNLSDDVQGAVFEQYRQQAVLIHVTAAPEIELPRCTDPDDQKFLELAWQARAGCLLSRDRSLLRLRRACARRGLFEVLSPQAWTALHPDV